MLKFGAIGAGMISQSGYDGITASGSAEVVAIADINPTRLRAYAERNKVGRTYATAEDLLKNNDLDAVYIAVPNVFHAPYAIAALESGKHVILDKPFATGHAEARKVIDAANRAKKRFMLGMNQRFTEGAQRAHVLAQKGYFGDIYRMRAFWRRRSGIPRLGTWFGSKKQSGGGCFLDIGVHMLDLALWTAGDFEAESVTGSIYTKFGNRGLGEGGWGSSDPEGVPLDVDDCALAFVRMKSGATVMVEISWASHQKEGDMYNVELFGSEAGALLYPGEIFTHDRTVNAPVNIADMRLPLTYPHRNRFVNFVKSILGEEEQCVTHDQALKVQRIIDAVYESAASRREVRL
jgi:predicted dehydrogenase